MLTEEIKSHLIEIINLYLKEIEASYDDNSIFKTSEKIEELAKKVSQYNQTLGEYYQLVEDELRNLLDYFEDLPFGKQISMKKDPPIMINVSPLKE